MLTAVGILIAAVLADAVLGDPVYPWHPVRLMGRSVTALEAGLRRCGWPGYGGGALLLIVELALWGGGSGLLLTLLKTASWPLQALLAVFLLYSCIALTDLCRHAQPVARALQENDLARARARVQMIVGRNAALLDAPGVARAAVESVAEGFVDGYLSPLFWFATAAVAAAAAGLDPVTWGAAAAVGYRITNTLDSMVGYRNQRYQRFGTASARCDDLVNFIPARLAVPILTLAAFLTGADAGAGWRFGGRDGLKQACPNAAQA
jgi:adenosylcobinamide-phosphate synthase